MGVFRWTPHCLRVCFLLLSLRCIHGQQEFDTICRSEPVTVGEMGVMNISLRPQIDLAKGKVFIYLKKENDSVDTLRCARQRPELSLKCETVQGSGFLTEGLVDHKLSLVVPKATVHLAGVYVLMVYINDVPDPPVNCVFTVLRETETQHLAASDEGDSNPVPIVVPILVVLLGIAIATGLLIYWYRRRKQKPKQEKVEEEEPMNTRNRIDSTGAADEGDFANITPNTTYNTTSDVNTAISTDVTATITTATTTTAATINPITTSAPVDTNTTPTTSTDDATTTSSTTTTSPNNITNVPTPTSTITTTTNSTTTTTTSSDIDTNASTTATLEASNTTPTTTDTQPARGTKDIDEGATPVKVNRLLASRAAGRTNRPSARDRLSEEDTTTDRNTSIGRGLQQTISKDATGFKGRGKRHLSTEFKDKDVFYTAVGSEMK